MENPKIYTADDLQSDVVSVDKHKRVKVNQDFVNLADKLMSQFTKNDSIHKVDQKWVEWVASKFVVFGYELNPDIIQMISDYLAGYNLWICGNVGTGKTFFFDVMGRVRKSKGLSGIVKLSMIDTQGWDMEMAREWAQDTSEYDVVIDDVGVEPVMKSWGQEAELFPYLLEKRMQLSKNRTHLTSNLGILDIKKRYGERVADRFVQTFKMEQMRISKKSKRKLKPWKKSSEDGMMIL